MRPKTVKQWQKMRQNFGLIFFGTVWVFFGSVFGRVLDRIFRNMDAQIITNLFLQLFPSRAREIR